MYKPFLSLLIFSLFLISGCNTASDFPGNEYVTLKIVHGWCMPACETEFTITPNKTFYKEENFQNEEGAFYEGETNKNDWLKIEFYLETTGYRTIETEPTNNIAVDGNDVILEIKEQRFNKKIYYTGEPEVESIEDFYADLYQMRTEFLAKMEEVVPD